MKYILYGIASSYVYDVHESARRLGWELGALVHNVKEGEVPTDLGPIVNLREMADEWRETAILIPLITPAFRKSAEGELRTRDFLHFPTLVDPSSGVASTSQLAEGVLVNAGVVIASKCQLDRFSLVNRSCSVGHHCHLEAYATLGPASVLCGSCTIERGAFVGAGAIVNPGVTIGSNAIVGSGAVVVSDVPAHTVAVGNPAKVIEEGIAGYGKASV